MKASASPSAGCDITLNVIVAGHSSAQSISLSLNTRARAGYIRNESAPPERRDCFSFGGAPSMRSRCAWSAAGISPGAEERAGDGERVGPPLKDARNKTLACEVRI